MTGNTNITKLLQNKNGNDAISGTIPGDILLLQRNFLQCEVEGVRMEELRIAAKLAKFAINLVHDIF